MIGRTIDENEDSPCTATFTSGGFFISAAHCSDNSFDVVEFNVDDSNPTTGDMNFSDPDDQYSINYATADTGFVDPLVDDEIVKTRIGRDWWIFEVGVNGSGESIFDNQNSALRLSSDYHTSVGSGLDGVVEGYGGDSENLKNFTLQQDSVGNGISKWEYNGGESYFEHQIDTQGGTSGAALITSGVAIGIHVVGLCETTGYDANYAMSIANSNISDAFEDFWKTDATLYVDSGHPTTETRDGSIFKPYTTLGAAISGASSGDVIYVRDGPDSSDSLNNK